MTGSLFTRDRLTAAALVLAYVAALAWSWRHLAATFSALELPADAWVGAVGATAVDLGLAVLALAVAHEARRGRKTWKMWAAVAFFAGISVLANADHGLSVELGRVPVTADLATLDHLAAARILVFAATLPALVLVLAWVIDRLASGPVESIAPAPERPTTALAVQVNDEVHVGTPASGRPERLAQLQALLTDRPTATTEELGAATGVSRATVHRDLAALRRQEARRG